MFDFISIYACMSFRRRKQKQQSINENCTDTIMMWFWSFIGCFIMIHCFRFLIIDLCKYRRKKKKKEEISRRIVFSIRIIIKQKITDVTTYRSRNDRFSWRIFMKNIFRNIGKESSVLIIGYFILFIITKQRKLASDTN